MPGRRKSRTADEKPCRWWWKEAALLISRECSSAAGCCRRRNDLIIHVDWAFMAMRPRSAVNQAPRRSPTSRSLFRVCKKRINFLAPLAIDPNAWISTTQFAQHRNGKNMSYYLLALAWSRQQNRFFIAPQTRKIEARRKIFLHFNRAR